MRQKTRTKRNSRLKKTGKRQITRSKTKRNSRLKNTGKRRIARSKLRTGGAIKTLHLERYSTTGFPQ